ncbi:uncharacterized protein LOC118199236 [Stegodyphus dumicola]|uniref:uncharacterized protein LOC118199236 n=1 Tax=Stegodyphus dumicola TaxID=202533 RepID=UPI0015A89A06|nr:uncharacterized protein LOC118199236 [Stegodyphus dumicola]
MLAVTRVFRTVSTEVVCLLAGVPPLSFQYNFYYKKFLLSNNLVDHIDINECVIKSEAFLNFDDDCIHPSNKILIPYDCAFLECQEMNIFTDGSGLEGGIGGAIVVFFYGIEIQNWKFRLNSMNSVYQAEMYAIFEALNWIKGTLKIRYNINIYSDALSVLQTLSGPESKNSLVFEIKKTYAQLKDIHNIKLHWIKAHAGYEGNERADELAKSAAVDENVIIKNIPDSRRRATSTLYNYVLNEWKNNWEQSNRNCGFTEKYKY